MDEILYEFSYFLENCAIIIYFNYLNVSQKGHHKYYNFIKPILVIAKSYYLFYLMINYKSTFF